MKYQFILSLLFVAVACSHTRVEGDRELKGEEIPGFLSQYKKSYKDAVFYEKVYDNNRSYEVKHEEDDREISLTFDDRGTLIEREEDISLADLSEKVKVKILTYLDHEYPGNELLELEKRQIKDGRNLIDVEIRHDLSPSGYWEVSFTSDGNYVSRDLEDYKSVQTLF
jgi:hypothetical protein